MVDMKVFSSSYTVSSVPGAGFTVLSPVGGQAVVRGALYRIIILWERRAGWYAIAVLGRTKGQQCHWLLKGDRKSCDTECFCDW